MFLVGGDIFELLQVIHLSIYLVHQVLLRGILLDHNLFLHLFFLFNNVWQVRLRNVAECRIYRGFLVREPDTRLVVTQLVLALLVH